MLGVKAIGNATLIAYDEVPILATDPWLGDDDDAYFGSWRLSHEIPRVEKKEILDAKYVWFSHGHPDHLNPQSLTNFQRSSILLPDHVGGRIKRDLEQLNYRVTILPDRRWVDLSDRIRVFCISDYIQDAVLLVDVAGHLFINMNDSEARARLGLIPKIARSYQHSYLLRLSGYGDADMINFFDEDGKRIAVQRSTMVGRWLSQYAQRVGAKAVIPFSSFHQYQRTDSAWANQHVTPLSAYREGFNESEIEFIEPFVWVDCSSGETIPLKPKKLQVSLRPPEEFGDSWSDDLESNDRRIIEDYFGRKEALRSKFGFVAFVVGGKTHTIDLGGPKNRGIIFEAPRNSLITAISNQAFDDLLIGNFMKTTLHGIESLYSPNFNFIVAKYGDNGLAETKQELKDYLRQYRKRSGAEWYLHQLVRGGHVIFRRYVRKDSGLYATARSLYSGFLRN
jgi:hypothetical protein